MSLRKQLIRAVCWIMALSVVMPGIPLRGQSEITITDCSSDTALRSAVESATKDVIQEIKFACGSRTITLAGPLTVAGEIMIDGNGQITLSGGGLHNHFVSTGEHSLIWLKNLVLRDGFATSNDISHPAAASIFSNYQMILDNVTFTENHGQGSASSGAIVSRELLSIVNSHFVLNTGGIAGAIIGEKFTHIDGSSFVENQGRLAGAIYGPAYTNISSSRFVGNVSSEGAGAIYRVPPAIPGYIGTGRLYEATFAENNGPKCGAVASEFESFAISASTFSTNTSSAGGVICVLPGSDGAFEISQVTISGNVSAGAAIENTGSQHVKLTNSTVAGNHSTGGGAGALRFTRDARLSIVASIVANNGSQNCDLRNPLNVVNDYSVFGDSSCAVGTSTSLLSAPIVADPLLSRLQDNGGPTLTMIPDSGSPAAGVPSDSVCPRYDQRGVLRWMNSCDAGSVEVAQRSLRLMLPIVQRTWYPPGSTPTP